MIISQKRKHLSILFAIILSFAFVFVAISQLIDYAYAYSGEYSAEEPKTEHHITIFDNGVETTIKSDAVTVKEAIRRAGIELDRADIVEPILSTEINDEDFYINIYRAREVVVIDGYVKKYIKTAATEVSEIIAAADIELKEADLIKIVPFDGLLESGMTTAYEVVRAKEVKINFYGEEITKRTQAETVGELLQELKIERSAKKSWISQKDDVAIVDGLSLDVYHQGKQTVTTTEIIPFTEQITHDYSLTYGERKITKAGVLGSKTVTYEITMQDGQEIARNFISEIITKPAEAQQVTVGMKVELPAGSHEDWMAAAGIAASDYGYVNSIISHESGWRWNASNSRSGAYGLCQALPGSKMASAGADWETNPITQLRWCSGYATGRYGSWYQAYVFWQEHHWW